MCRAEMRTISATDDPVRADAAHAYYSTAGPFVLEPNGHVFVSGRMGQRRRWCECDKRRPITARSMACRNCPCLVAAAIAATTCSQSQDFLTCPTRNVM